MEQSAFLERNDDERVEDMPKASQMDPGRTAQDVRPRYRIGMGYDVHQLASGRKLILGGVAVPHTKGLAGHSDADALVHAVCDALLGAMGEGDLGRHFPSSNPAYKDIPSLNLLKHVCALLATHRYRIVNVDSTIIAQAPRLGGLLSTMAATMAEVMGVDPGAVNVKVKSGEGLDAVGHEEGIATQAVCLIEALSDK
ncbi:2-C-methyl-D-erythritol 2,4-cyclodiphosphate synthase [Nitrospira sp.]|nr:2-C-methyl-D-erythritol 2,4-cyclodiphosphate synthase [Nitrospira sp.]